MSNGTNEPASAKRVPAGAGVSRLYFPARKPPANGLQTKDTDVVVLREGLELVFENPADEVVVHDPPDPLADLARGIAGHACTEYRHFSGRTAFSFASRPQVKGEPDVRRGASRRGALHISGFPVVLSRVGGKRIAELRDQSSQSLDAFPRSGEQDVRFANIMIIEGTGASQLGIGMVTARIAEAILRDEHAVTPVGSYNPQYGVTVSLPSVLGRQGVSQILEAEMWRRNVRDSSAARTS